LLCRTALSSRRAREKQIDDWSDSNLPIGENPFEKVSVYRTRSSKQSVQGPESMSRQTYVLVLQPSMTVTSMDI